MKEDVIKKLNKLIDNIEYGDVTKNNLVDELNDVISEIQEMD